jgi:hypothetical protein
MAMFVSTGALRLVSNIGVHVEFDRFTFFLNVSTSEYATSFFFLFIV